MWVLRRSLVALSLCLSMGCEAPVQGQPLARAATGGLTVVELFTSQGCSSCPPANANLTVLARRPDVLALSFGVDYWDYLGWADTFANPAYTRRQRDYASALRLRAVYTPQMVINGREQLVGTRMSDVERSLALAGSLSRGPAISARGNRLSIAALQTTVRDTSVWFVAYDPRITQVPIARGENSGKTLPHVNVVRVLTRLGTYTGAAFDVALPIATDPALAMAILVQAGVGGPIISAKKL